MDVLDRADLPFPHSLPEFQRLFPDDAACAAYLEKARWGDGFACPHCGTAGEPFHFENRPGVLRCRKCRQNTGLTVGTVMECQWRSKKGPPRRCKKGPLGGCGFVPVVHGRAPRATRRALNRLTRRRAREGPVGPRGQAWAGWSVQLAVGV